MRATYLTTTKTLVRWQWPVAVIAGFCVLFALGGDAARLWARYERHGLESGELWRLLTAHLVHLDTAHLVLNMAGLALIGWLVGAALAFRDWVTIVVLGAVGIALGLYLFTPEVEWYVGLSGVLHTAFACGCARMLQRGERIGLLFASALIVKLGWEYWVGPLPLSEGSGPVIVEAHRYGAIAGVVAGLPRMPGARSAA